MGKTRKNNLKNRKNTFTEIDYQSNDGMLTSVWGPGMWHYLHTMSFNYPVKPTCHDKKHYSEFIYSLRNVLPCGKCRKNLCKNLKRLPLRISNMESRATFSKYIYDLHELINKMLGKKSGLTYETVRERYEHFRARCAKIKKNRTAKKLEKGCTVPLYGEKARCILKIVPEDTKCETLEIDDKCIKKPLYDVMSK
jgi:hypothetical protein|uniref:thiol oxidase n=1 Tax=viral metagenome TaxID=1070528 RepID=A0A6C0ASM3_9ZZZZ